MGWASGSMLAENLWEEIKKYLPKKHYKVVARKIIEEMESHDCDTIDECDDLVKAAQMENEYWARDEEE